MSVFVESEVFLHITIKYIGMQGEKFQYIYIPFGDSRVTKHYQHNALCGPLYDSFGEIQSLPSVFIVYLAFT